MKTSILQVGSVDRLFGSSRTIGWLGGLESRHHQASEDRFVFLVVHGVIPSLMAPNVENLHDFKVTDDCNYSGFSTVFETPTWSSICAVDDVTAHLSVMRA